jgi:hypothetical protein
MMFVFLVTRQRVATSPQMGLALFFYTVHRFLTSSSSFGRESMANRHSLGVAVALRVMAPFFDCSSFLHPDHEPERFYLPLLFFSRPTVCLLFK